MAEFDTPDCRHEEVWGLMFKAWWARGKWRCNLKPLNSCMLESLKKICLAVLELLYVANVCWYVVYKIKFLIRKSVLWP